MEVTLVVLSTKKYVTKETRLSKDQDLFFLLRRPAYEAYDGNLGTTFIINKEIRFYLYIKDIKINMALKTHMTLNRLALLNICA